MLRRGLAIGVFALGVPTLVVGAMLCLVAYDIMYGTKPIQHTPPMPEPPEDDENNLSWLCRVG